MKNLRWKLAGWINDKALDARSDVVADFWEWLYEKVYREEG